MNHPYRELLYRFFRWARQSFSILWLVVAAVYLMVLAGHAVFRNYQSQEEMASLRKQLEGSKLEKERLGALLVYYQTDSFKEKELRRTLLLKKPSEKMYALPESGVSKRVEDELALSVQKEQQKKNVSGSSIWNEWTRYLSTGEK